MKTSGSMKVVVDASGHPWLVVGTDLGYEAWRIEITERRLFERSWQAVRFASDQRVDEPIELVEVDVDEDGAA